MTIAARALATSAVLVTKDEAFSHVEQALKVDDWSP
jgi:predicted nucleic acid-binding protein